MELEQWDGGGEGGSGLSRARWTARLWVTSMSSRLTARVHSWTNLMASPAGKTPLARLADRDMLVPELSNAGGP